MSNFHVPSRIFLVGPMGAGKTTIGTKLAESLHKQFIDSDREIERKTGADIPLIFELEGEAGFRKRESQSLEELSLKKDFVLATGGGAVIAEKNRNILKQSGYVIFLHAPLEQLLERTAKDRNRPLLQTDNPRKTLANILQQREPLYRDVADLVFETNQKTLRDIVHDLIQILKNTSEN